MSLALARVDDRLVHGQVVLAWAGTLKAQRLLVADDAAAAAAWERQLMQVSAGDLEVDVFPVAETAARLREESAKSGPAILLFRSPRAALAAAQAGALIEELNLGGLHHAPGRTPVLDYLYLNDDDRAALRELLERGVRLTARDLPSSRPQAAAEWLEPGNAA